MFPKISDCKKVSGTWPTMTDSPTKICVVTAKFFVRDGITMLMSATTFKYIECLVWLMPTLSNSDEKPQDTLLTGMMRKGILGPSPANASMPVNAPSGIGMPFRLKFFKLDCEMDAVSRAILLIFKAFAEKEMMSPASFFVMVTRSKYRISSLKV